MQQPTLPAGLSPEQTQTVTLLRQLLGSAIANRYLDFCKLANGGIPLHTTRTLAGHAMRELESLKSGGGASLPPGMENFSL